MYTLGYILSHPERLPLSADLFLPSDEVWSAATSCAVLAVDRYAENDTPPAYATDHGLQRSLQVGQIREVVRNARLQRDNATVEELVRAFLFYYDHDAFIDFHKQNKP
jgi:hypothetical protein